MTGLRVFAAIGWISSFTDPFLGFTTLNPKNPSGGINLTPCPSPPLLHPPILVAFPKIHPSCKKRVKPWLFVTFDIIISHNFPENFIKILQIVQNIWRLSLSVLAISVIFLNFLVTKKLMTAACNKRCQHFLTFNILQIDCLTFV